MIYSIQVVIEKAFWHSQISMISLQKFLVTFNFVGNLLSNVRPEMAL